MCETTSMARTGPKLSNTYSDLYAFSANSLCSCNVLSFSDREASCDRYGWEGMMAVGRCNSNGHRVLGGRSLYIYICVCSNELISRFRNHNGFWIYLNLEPPTWVKDRSSVLVASDAH